MNCVKSHIKIGKIIIVTNVDYLEHLVFVQYCTWIMDNENLWGNLLLFQKWFEDKDGSNEDEDSSNENS